MGHDIYKLPGNQMQCYKKQNKTTENHKLHKNIEYVIPIISFFSFQAQHIQDSAKEWFVLSYLSVVCSDDSINLSLKHLSDGNETHKDPVTTC